MVKFEIELNNRLLLKKTLKLEFKMCIVMSTIEQREQELLIGLILVTQINWCVIYTNSNFHASTGVKSQGKQA